MLHVSDFPALSEASRPWSAALPEAASQCRIVAVTPDDRVLMQRRTAPWRLAFPEVALLPGESCDEAVQRELADGAGLGCETVETLGRYGDTQLVYATGLTLVAPPARVARDAALLLLPYSRLLQWIDTGGFEAAQALSFGLAVVRRLCAQAMAPQVAAVDGID